MNLMEKSASLAVLLAATLLTACGGSSSSSSTAAGNNLCNEIASDSFSCSALLANMAEQQQSRINTFADAIATLNTNVGALCDALSSAGEADALITAQASLSRAATAWQQLEVMQFGPVTEAVRNDFYSWPLSVGKEGQINSEIAFVNDGGEFDPTPTKRGLTAVEYILNDNPQGAGRCDYAELATGKMAEQSQALKTASAAFAPDQSSNPQSEIQDVFDALFYVYNQTKGEKIQKTILPQNANDTFKSSQLEYQYADLNRAAVEANLLATQAIFTGADELGLQDMLIAAGQPSLANAMEAALTTAVAAAADSEFSQSWRAILTAADQDYVGDDDVGACISITADTTAQSTDLEKLCSLDKKIKVFTDDLKGQAALTLNLTVPKDAESDGD